MSSRCLWNRRHEGAGPTSPPRRAVMWGMEQIPAALAQKSNYHHVLKLFKNVTVLFFIFSEAIAAHASDHQNDV
jgi:hypothetical protein